MKSSAYHFHMKTKILADFQISNSVPLIGEKTRIMFLFQYMENLELMEHHLCTQQQFKFDIFLEENFPIKQDDEFCS